tara:strand:- start:1503 stop:2288 length:786 start_codon:yes stop_codon:yes gene_type:complete
MRLRRLTEHIREQNWFAVALDFLIVVVGILIAFQITSWNEARNNRRLEAQYLSLLVTDLENIETNLSAQLTSEQYVVANAKIALKAVNNREIGADPLLIGQSMHSIFGRRTASLDSPVFSEMKSAGRLTLLRDTALRSRIIAYFDGLSRGALILDKNNEAFAEAYTAYLRDSGIGIVQLPKEFCVNVVSQGCTTSTKVSSVFGSEKTHSAGKIFNVPPDAPFWATARSQIVWRGVSAIASADTVEQLLSDTQTLLAELEVQ